MVDFLTNKRYLGLDIGNSAVKMAEVSVDGGTVRLRKLLKKELPAMPDDIPETERTGIIVSAIRELCREGRFFKRSISCNLSGAFVASRLFTLPTLSQEELSVYFRQHAQDYLPARVNLSEVEFDFQVLREEIHEGKEIGQVILAAARKQAVEEQMKLVEAAGIFPCCLDASSMSLVSTFSLDTAFISSKLMAVVDVGHRYTKVLVIKDRILSFAIEFPIGGEAVTKALQEKFNLDSAEADQLKKSLSRLEGGDTATRIGDAEIPVARALEAYREVLNRIVEELKKIRQYHGAGKTWQRVILTGGAAKTKGLKEAIASGLSCAVDIPLAIEGVLSEEVLSDLIPEFGLAIGLALKQVNPLINSINLLPEDQRKRIEHHKTKHDISTFTLKTGATLAGIATLLLIVGGIFSILIKLDIRKMRRTRVQYQEAVAIRDLNRAVKDYIVTGEKLPGSRSRYSLIMFQISKMIPQGLWLNGFSIGSRMKPGQEENEIEQIPQISVTGNCDSEQPAINLLRAFEKSPLFSSPELKFMEKGKGQSAGNSGGDDLKFEIKAIIKNGGGL
jgi:type IV pilus assembly protein PilM